MWLLSPESSWVAACWFSRLLFILLWHFIYTGFFAVTLEDTLVHYRNDLFLQTDDLGMRLVNVMLSKNDAAIKAALRFSESTDQWEKRCILDYFFSLSVNDAGLSDLLSHFGWLELRALSISQEVLCLAELGHCLKKVVVVVGNPCKVLLFVT